MLYKLLVNEGKDVVKGKDSWKVMRRGVREQLFSNWKQKSCTVSDHRGSTTVTNE